MGLLKKKKEVEVVKAEVEEAQVQPPQPPEEPKEKQLDPDVKQSVERLTQKFGGLYQTPIDQSNIQRDEQLTITLAIYHEPREIKLLGADVLEMLKMIKEA